jgi:hypothetical protein
MVNVEVTDKVAIFEVEGLDKVWALKSRLEIPLRHLRDIRIDPEATRGWWHGLRLPGTNLPGVMTAGTFYQQGRRIFWDVHDPEQTIVIELTDDRYDELIIEVEDPDDAAARLRTGVANHLNQLGLEQTS